MGFDINTGKVVPKSAELKRQWGLKVGAAEFNTELSRLSLVLPPVLNHTDDFFQWGIKASNAITESKPMQKVTTLCQVLGSRKTPVCSVAVKKKPKQKKTHHTAFQLLNQC